MSFEGASRQETSRSCTVRTAPAGISRSPPKVIDPVTALGFTPQIAATSTRAAMRMANENARTRGGYPWRPTKLWASVWAPRIVARMASRICLAHARLEDGPQAGQDGAAADDGTEVAVATKMHLLLEFPKGGVGQGVTPTGTVPVGKGTRLLSATHPDNASRHNRRCSEPARSR